MKNVLRGLFGLVLLWQATAHALVIYDNAATVNNGVFSDPSTPQFIADDFSLKAGLNVITGIHWTGVYAGNAPIEPDNFSIQIFADGGETPASTPIISLSIGDPGRTNTGINIFSDDLFEYSMNISPITVNPNTTFWLSIVNETSTGMTNDWAWGSQLLDLSGGVIAARSNETEPWFLASDFVQDFALSGPATIPEPATIMLFAVGALGLLGTAVTPRDRQQPS
ncbi:MAG: hypothetical protein ACREQW_19775 [Candidatus Binatia bacterium]